MKVALFGLPESDGSYPLSTATLKNKNPASESPARLDSSCALLDQSNQSARRDGQANGCSNLLFISIQILRSSIN